MTAVSITDRFVADVKCYHCGHISGQIFGRKRQPLRPADFVPRHGYAGPSVESGKRLRCERCHGPVFLEDSTNSQPLRASLRRARPGTQRDVGAETAV